MTDKSGVKTISSLLLSVLELNIALPASMTPLFVLFQSPHIDCISDRTLTVQQFEKVQDHRGGLFCFLDKQVYVNRIIKQT